MREGDHTVVDDAVRELARAVEEGLENHPDPETLLAHHRRQLPSEAASAVEDHLLWCRDCASFGRHTPVVEEDLRPADPNQEADEWEVLRRRLASDSVGGEGAGPSRWPPTLAGGTKPSRPFAVARAAVMAVALVAGGALVGHLATEEATPIAPQPNVRIVDLAPAVADRATGTEPMEVSTDALAVLVLNARLPEETRSYEARFVDAAGRTAYTVRNLIPTEYGNLHIGLPPGSIGPGSYRIDLVGTGASEPTGTFQVRFLQPEQ